jgi:type IV pilus assembly protein PilO
MTRTKVHAMQIGTREWIFLLLLIAIPVAAYFCVFEPRNRQIQDAREEIQQKRMKLKQLEDATMEIDDLGHEIERLSDAINLFEQKLPAQREVEVILKQIWELASRHQLTPKSVRTDKITSAVQYSELPISVKIIGDFDGYYSFLLDLEQLSRITKITKMVLNKLNTGEGQMEAEIVLSIFFEPQSHQAAVAGL